MVFRNEQLSRMVNNKCMYQQNVVCVTLTVPGDGTTFHRVEVRLISPTRTCEDGAYVEQRRPPSGRSLVHRGQHAGQGIARIEQCQVFRQESEEFGRRTIPGL
jgi:hypothetical protein